MDAEEVQRLLREEGERFREQVSEIDAAAVTERVLRRIGADPVAAARPARRCAPPRGR